MSQELKPGTIYAQDYFAGKPGKLYTLDLATGQATLVGEITTKVYDLAFVGQSLYGLNKKDFGFRKTMKLIKVDLETGTPEIIGDTQFDVVGLAYNPVDKKLYATAHRNAQIVSINLTTGKATPVVRLGTRDRQCGEIAFDPQGKAYITLIGTDLKKYLATCNLVTGEVTLIGDIGFPGLASMKFIGDALYGVAGEYEGVGGSNGQVIRIDTTTGQGTLVTTTVPSVCWAGMAVYASSSLATSSQVDQPTVSQNGKTTQEKDMQLLTIDTKANCYVINPEQMNTLQQSVASSFTLEQGTFDLQITSGRYSYNAAETEGEPAVLLWIYGVDGQTFINKGTGIEIGTTWTTLNGYGDRLQLEVKEKAVVCAVFFDINSQDNGGTIELSITSSSKPNFSPQKLAVNGQTNCYVLDEAHLTSLQQWNANFVELVPGNYRLKIRESNASYWSSAQKFQLEPWALLWIKVGKFTPKLTGIEVKESWCSLNGLKDDLILEVKEKTTLSGFFFDTYKEDNEGQIILAIEPVSAEEVIRLYAERGNKEAVPATSGDKKISTIGDGRGDVSTKVGVDISGEGVSVGGGSSFDFRFDQAQIEAMWKQMAANIETSVTVRSGQDEQREAYWENLEKWILKSYQQQAKDLAMQVARVEFMMKAFTQQMEGSFNQIFQGWTRYFDTRLSDIVDSTLLGVIERQVNLKLTQQAQDIKALVIEQMQADLENRIGTTLNLKLTQQSQDIKALVIEQMQADLEERIGAVVNVKISDQTPEINGFIIQQIQGEMDKRIDAVVTLKTDEQTDRIKNLVIQQIQGDIDRRVDDSIRVAIDAQIENIKNLVIQQIQGDIEKRLEAMVNVKLTEQTEVIKNLVMQQVEANIDKRIQLIVDQSSEKNIDVMVNNVMGDVDKRINVNFENKILDFRQGLAKIVQDEINDNYTDSLRTLVLSDIENQKFYLDIQSIQNEVMNFYSRLGQFEAQLNLRIAQGDARLYNWTLEQLTALQSCMTDRQALVDMLEAFSSRLKGALDEAPCVQPTRFTPWITTETNPQIEPGGSVQLPG